MSLTLTAPCVGPGEPPITVPEATVIVIIVVLAAALAFAGLPTLSVFVLLAEAADTGVRLVRRLRAVRGSPGKRG